MFQKTILCTGTSDLEEIFNMNNETSSAISFNSLKISIIDASHKSLTQCINCEKILEYLKEKINKRKTKIQNQKEKNLEGKE